MSKQYTTCPYCSANLDPGERCDCQSVAPAGTRPEIIPVRKPDGCKKFTHAESAPVHNVHPSLPGLPLIVFCHSKPQSNPGHFEPSSK